MKTTRKTSFLAATVLLTAFVLWTVAVLFIDVQAIGPNGSRVGFATLNSAVHNTTGMQMWLYDMTDWLSLIPLTIVGAFGITGLMQWIRRKSFFKVDADILVLGGFYIAVMAAFLFFETVVINYRPVLIEGVLEASYPSSTTMLMLCVMPTAIMQLRTRMRHSIFKTVLIVAMIVFTAVMVIGRVLSGVHWATDIIGGVLLSAGLVSAYRGCVLLTKKQ